MNNLEIRLLIADNGLRHKDVAAEMNVCPEWLSRLLRRDLTPENRIRILAAIERLLKGAEDRDIQ